MTDLSSPSKDLDLQDVGVILKLHPSAIKDYRYKWSDLTRGREITHTSTKPHPTTANMNSTLEV